MHDVAQRAGVSQTTVSLVLNDPENCGIPATTQQRIHEAIRDVGYRRNRLARAMRLSRTDTLGFIADDLATTPYANQMIQGAQEAAWTAGKLLLIVNTGSVDDANHRELERAAVDQLLERQVDGIVLAAMYHRIIEPPPALGEVRSVLLDARSSDGSMASVVPDEHQAAYDATSHLIAAGHTRIAHITTDYPAPAPPPRRAGYLAALADHGLPVDDDLLVTNLGTTGGGRLAAAELLARPEPPTAVFCYNDQVAMGVYQVAGEAGVRIPDDLAVVGIDDQALIAGQLRPALTTMRLPHHEMGQWAVNWLLDDERSAIEHTIACPLVDRDSVRS
ncbi:MAG: LacI family DNA-binding transcriptional regulator [Actinomycetota bacterium]